MDTQDQHHAIEQAHHIVRIPVWVIVIVAGLLVTACTGLVWLGGQVYQSGETANLAEANAKAVAAESNWQAAVQQANHDRDAQLRIMQEQINQISSTQDNLREQLAAINAKLGRIGEAVHANEVSGGSHG